MKKAFLVIITAAFLIMALIPAYAADTAKPVALYRFDTPSSPGMDSSGNGNDLEVRSATENVGYSLENGKLSLESAVLRCVPGDDGNKFTDKLTDFTYTVKARVDAIGDGTQIAIISTGYDWDNIAGGFTFGVLSDGTVYVDTRSSEVWKTVNLNDSLGANWFESEHRYTITYDTATTALVLYIDATPVISSSTVQNFNVGCPNATFSVGGLNAYALGDFLGYLGEITVSELAVFDKALSADEVAGIGGVFAEEAATEAPAEETTSAPDTQPPASEGTDSPSTGSGVILIGIAALASAAAAITAGKKHR